jgi:hypothetical protein
MSALDLVLRAREAVGHDVTPGHDQLHHYWTREPEGRERWIHAPHPFYALVEQLIEHAHVTAEVAKRWAGAWYPEVFGYAPGSDINRVRHGKPPRGNRIGPG